MCGIAGYYLWRRGGAPDLEKALFLLRHRGPDAARLWKSPDGTIGLAHTRLSILDLSEAAHQPFRRGDYWLVYNGEVYNFLELTKEGGFRPRTRSDTEVLLWAYEAWGEAFVERLEGMFAFALYDAAQHSLYLARDPYGIKPLWVAIRSEGVYFASELKVLKAWLPDLRVRPQAIAEFLHLGFIPAPGSWYEGVYKVLPGELWHIHPRGYTQRVYYDRSRLWLGPKRIASRADLLDTIEAELRRAVRAHLVSDVPVGLFLSGGTDSSLVAAMAVAEGQSLQAFTIGFAENTHNELPYAKAVAEHLGLPIESEILAPEVMLALLPEMHTWYDEPFGDVSAIPTYLVSRLAARSIKVVLAGDGGDELFWGYGRYRWAWRLSRLRRLWRASVPLFAHAPSPRFKRVGELLALPASAISEHIFSQEQYTFSWREVRMIYPAAKEPWETPFPLPPHPTEAQAAWDFLHYLPDDLLTKVDRASMQHSLEVRVPLLDKKWVELAWQIPSAFKHPRHGRVIQYKPLLRALLRRYLPQPLVERKKWGFTIPLAAWLQGPLKDWAWEYAHPQKLSRTYDLRQSSIEALWRRFKKGEGYLATRIWLLAQLGIHDRKGD